MDEPGSKTDLGLDIISDYIDMSQNTRNCGSNSKFQCFLLATPAEVGQKNCNNKN